MIVNYDTQKINRILDDFFNATGINMDILKDDFSFVCTHSHREDRRYCRAILATTEGKKACMKSDSVLLNKCRKSQKPQMHICHAGLIDVAVPIVYNKEIIGYLIFGQIKTDTDFKGAGEYIRRLGLDEAEMNAYYNEIVSFDTAKIKSISTIAEILVKHILLENILVPNYDESMSRAVSYINDNLTEELSVQSVSKNANISKSSLYRRFHSTFGCTLNQYINKRRVENAVDLLVHSDLTVDEISRKVGFSGCSYFNKIFKKEKGISPFQFKKIHSY